VRFTRYQPFRLLFSHIAFQSDGPACFSQGLPVKTPQAVAVMPFQAGFIQNEPDFSSGSLFHYRQLPHYVKPSLVPLSTRIFNLPLEPKVCYI
jgi:hypothetical protein